MSWMKPWARPPTPVRRMSPPSGKTGKMKTGVLLINLGTPDQARPWAVARYLREFLMDPYVLDIPWLARAALVYLLILPFRSFKSARAYRQIWRGEVGAPEGSPLKHFHL